MKIRDEIRNYQNVVMSWEQFAEVLVAKLSNLPIEYLKVFEKIGEEIGEFVEEIANENNRENLIEEAVDLLVTSTAAVKSLQELSGVKVSGEIKRTEGVVNLFATTKNPFEVANGFLSDFVIQYGKLAKAQRKYRSNANEETGLKLVSCANLLMFKAYDIASSLTSRKTVEEIFNRKVDKWRSYATRCRSVGKGRVYE